MLVNNSHVLVKTQTDFKQHRRGNSSPAGDVSTQLKDDILVSTANTGHYCLATPAPPLANPMSVSVSAAGHMNPLELHPEQSCWLTLARAMQRPSRFLDESIISRGS